MNERQRSFAHNIPAARRLRRTQTETEALLWGSLRNRQLANLKFRRQHAFGRYVVDFYCDDARLVVEVDGGIHLDPEQQARDRVRQAELESQDLAFVRISVRDVSSDLPAVLARIVEAARERGPFGTATPPLPQRRERGQGGEG
ncbi:MAG: endonuclease domain-containing protein [Chloroflexi bacterium]|nr:endonuclease domain-containing protein [Chloroflexota bacterium]